MLDNIIYFKIKIKQTCLSSELIFGYFGKMWEVRFSINLLHIFVGVCEWVFEIEGELPCNKKKQKKTKAHTQKEKSQEV